MFSQEERYAKLLVDRELGYAQFNADSRGLHGPIVPGQAGCIVRGHFEPGNQLWDNNVLNDPAYVRPNFEETNGKGTYSSSTVRVQDFSTSLSAGASGMTGKLKIDLSFTCEEAAALVLEDRRPISYDLRPEREDEFYAEACKYILALPYSITHYTFITGVTNAVGWWKNFVYYGGETEVRGEGTVGTEGMCVVAVGASVSYRYSKFRSPIIHRNHGHCHVPRNETPSNSLPSTSLPSASQSANSPSSNQPCSAASSKAQSDLPSPAYSPTDTMDSTSPSSQADPPVTSDLGGCSYCCSDSACPVRKEQAIFIRGFQFRRNRLGKPKAVKLATKAPYKPFLKFRDGKEKFPSNWTQSTHAGSCGPATGSGETPMQDASCPDRVEISAESESMYDELFDFIFEYSAASEWAVIHDRQLVHWISCGGELRDVFSVLVDEGSNVARIACVPLTPDETSASSTQGQVSRSSISPESSPSLRDYSSSLDELLLDNKIDLTGDNNEEYQITSPLETGGLTSNVWPALKIGRNRYRRKGPRTDRERERNAEAEYSARMKKALRELTECLESLEPRLTAFSSRRNSKVDVLQGASFALNHMRSRIFDLERLAAGPCGSQCRCHAEILGQVVESSSGKPWPSELHSNTSRLTNAPEVDSSSDSDHSASSRKRQKTRSSSPDGSR